MQKNLREEKFDFFREKTFFQKSRNRRRAGFKKVNQGLLWLTFISTNIHLPETYRGRSAKRKFRVRKNSREEKIDFFRKKTFFQKSRNRRRAGLKEVNQGLLWLTFISTNIHLSETDRARSAKRKFQVKKTRAKKSSIFSEKKRFFKNL